MTLRDDLIAAKALIDTPEKWIKTGSWNALLLTVGEDRAFPAYASLEQQVPRVGNHLRYYENENGITHADIMALFDRAIDAAAGEPS